jgi:acetyl-CoA C-acetyltransferase
MPYVASIGTYLPCWGAPRHRVAGDAKDHPSGATGVAQCVELFAQLRGEAANHVDGARVALAHNIGGPTAVSAVTILEGSASGTG